MILSIIGSLIGAVLGNLLGSWLYNNYATPAPMICPECEDVWDEDEESDESHLDS